MNAMSASAVAFLRALDRNRTRVAAQFNLTGTELRALARIVETGGITPKMLAEALQMTTGAVTAISNRLVAMDLVTRVPHPHDRRSLLLELAPAAGQIAQTIYDDFEALIARAVRDVSPEDQARLGDLLAAMALSIGAGDARELNEPR
ncbi:MarR family transcriptional regulator [Cryobacterium sp. PH29-G1]|uniref:MarR family winged helix-turn-helix transcriptional regulator n=1 Tax=Cryobacterium sp. PH29-G1 TaxID=3046211 RepID=UPI0024BAD66E|nr:MarR family transcriptional regulator [Cryobacterium sp. PH29-G1]MDJ0348665.1 MarR family transcriptional regulator [Cryobacterium sp. PH29-G1]